jgi:hypothetical protein
VVHKGERFLIQNLEKPKQWTIKDNLLVWARKRLTPSIDITKIWDPVAGLFMWSLYTS